MVFVPVSCPLCGETHVVKRGRTEQGKQRYLCVNQECPKNTFLLDYSYNGALPEVKAKIIAMALNGSGVRDTARVLEISPTTVIEELKKKNRASNW
jgi:insertion element IS1 protein InsB